MHNLWADNSAVKVWGGGMSRVEEINWGEGTPVIFLKINLNEYIKK